MSVSSAPLPTKVNAMYFSQLAKLPYSRQRRETFWFLPLCDNIYPPRFSATSVTGKAVAIHAPMCSPGLCLRGYVATTVDSSRNAAEPRFCAIRVRNLRRSFDCDCAGAALVAQALTTAQNTEDVCSAAVLTLFGYFLDMVLRLQLCSYFFGKWHNKSL